MSPLDSEVRRHDATRWWLFGFGCALIVSAGLNVYLLLR